MCDRYQLGDSKTTKIIIIEMLVIAIETEQVPASENANIDKFTRFQTFAQIAISCEWLGGCGLGDDLGRRLFFL